MTVPAEPKKVTAGSPKYYKSAFIIPVRSKIWRQEYVRTTKFISIGNITMSISILCVEVFVLDMQYAKG